MAAGVAGRSGPAAARSFFFCFFGSGYVTVILRSRSLRCRQFDETRQVGRETGSARYLVLCRYVGSPRLSRTGGHRGGWLRWPQSKSRIARSRSRGTMLVQDQHKHDSIRTPHSEQRPILSTAAGNESNHDRPVSGEDKMQTINANMQHTRENIHAGQQIGEEARKRATKQEHQKKTMHASWTGQ